MDLNLSLMKGMIDGMRQIYGPATSVDGAGASYLVSAANTLDTIARQWPIPDRALYPEDTGLIWALVTGGVEAAHDLGQARFRLVPNAKATPEVTAALAKLVPQLCEVIETAYDLYAQQGK